VVVSLAKHEQVLLKMIVNGLFSRKGSTYTSSPMFIGINYLIPKGLGLPYVGFSDSGQTDVNAINFWII
jgi:hypothetical protein